MLSIKNKVYLIASFFFIWSCYVLFSNYSLNVILLAEIAFFIVFLKHKTSTDWSVILFWSFFILSELLFTFSKDYINILLPTLLKLFGYLMLCVCGFSKQKALSVKRFDYLIYGLLIFLNTYVVRAIIDIIEPFITVKYLVELYFVLGLALIFLGAFAIRYRLIGDSKSKYFALGVLFLTLSEIIRVIAHNLNLLFLHYFQYFFFSFGLSFFVLFSIVENKNDSAFKLIKTRGV